MKLIIKEYLSLLKESKELDSLIPELLLAMGHEVISKPQIGVRQYGVDVASVGIDKDGIKKVFLFTIKEGDFGRTDWDNGTLQAVRPSLNEIIDSYIPKKLSPDNKSLVKKIILATGGDKKQEIDENWDGYIETNAKKDEIEFEFWGGDKLALLIEEYIFNEFIIPKEQRSLFRRTLALIGDTDYGLRDYYEFLDEVLYNVPEKSDSDLIVSYSYTIQLLDGIREETDEQTTTPIFSRVQDESCFGTIGGRENPQSNCQQIRHIAKEPTRVEKTIFGECCIGI